MAAPLAPAEDLVVHAATRTILPGAPFTFEVAPAAPGLALADCTLSFPGFTADRPAERLPTGAWRFAGRLARPGFYALRATGRSDHATLSGRDYFVAAEPVPVPARQEAGYYVFLGCGDYPIITGQESHPLAAWSQDQWLGLVDWMADHGFNRLWTLVNGYTLAYPSQRYPTLRDRHCRNAAENFLGAVIAHAHRRGVKVYLMLTTDGHARDFCRAHPEAERRNADGTPGPHHGLALEHPLTQRYLYDTLEEVLALYPAADGLAVHPTESDPDRFNPESVAAFRAETGRDLFTEPLPIRRAWHNRAYARFLAAFFARARQLRPGLDLVMANCWWQDDYVAENLAHLPADVRIAVWHYAWEETEPKPWPIHRWVAAFGANRVLYVPTSQSYLYPTDPRRVMDRHLGTDRLISTAAILGVRDTMYFAGWEILPADARLLDAALVHHPSAGRARPLPDKFLERLYADYFAATAAS
ncbi:MAG: hypothetical protein JSR48_14965 [Verrucomicrobia bacterium]|nr:hypothetical protein [Verrucomicrobiota bacterium]